MSPERLSATADSCRSIDPHGSAVGACAIPPHIYEIAFGWDPRPEIERLLLLCREANVAVRSALELGCGTGRLLAELRSRVESVVGLELSEPMAALARRSGVEIVRGDMCDFALRDPADASRPRRFDLIYTSANTVRHVLSNAAVIRFWGCVARHLRPGGAFFADLELGLADQAAKVGRPASWVMARGATLVHATWRVVRAPNPTTGCCEIEWMFEARGHSPGFWRQRFPLRCYDAPEFISLAEQAGGLRFAGLYELRDPYLLERPPDRFEGRGLVLLRRPE